MTSLNRPVLLSIILLVGAPITCPNCASKRTVKMTLKAVYGNTVACLQCGYRWNSDAHPAPTTPADPDRSPDQSG